MKNFRLIACVLCALVVAFLESGCAAASSSRAPVRELRTYAIIAADSQGTLSQTELNSIVDTLVQFLLDRGYVRSDQILIDDPGRAAVVFRMKIAWNQGRTSFVVVSVISGFGGANGYAEAPPAYATSAPPPDDDWNNDPWRNDDDSGYAYGPYSPFFIWFPFASYDGIYRHHPPRSVIRRPPDHRGHSQHRPKDWGQYRHYVPPWQRNGESSFQLVAPPQRQSAAGHDDSAPVSHWNNPAPNHRARPANPPAGRPQTRDPEHRPAPDHSSRRPDSNVRASPQPSAVPAREPAQSPRFSPPPKRENPPAERNSTPSVSHSSPPASPSRSDTDSNSKTHDRDR